MPPFLQKVLLETNVKVFVHCIPFRKSKSGNDLRDQHFLNTYVEVEDPLPGINHISPVIHTAEVEISSIENAIGQVAAKNRELLHIVIKHEMSSDFVTPSLSSYPTSSPSLSPSPSPSNISQLTSVLQSAIESGVSGYKSAFFCAEYQQSSAQKVEQLQKLKEVLKEQVDIVERGLATYTRSPDENFHMEDSLLGFSKLKAEVKLLDIQ